jgi:ferrochelatase
MATLISPEGGRRRGLLLLNLGTPDAPRTPEVRRYLRQFLSDPRVLDLPALGRWALLHLVILPFRPAKSAAAYRKIWGQEGSPLLHFSRALEAGVQKELGGAFEVELAMRYGNPSIESALSRLRARGVEELTVFPLYPQYASSSTGSSLEAVFQALGREWNVVPLRTVPAFYDQPGYLDAFAEVGRPVLAELSPEHVLFSFHGLPERQIQKSDRSGAHCLKSETCCDRIVEANRFCYRAQSYATARGIAERLGLSKDGYSVSFQSRLGRTPWIKPYTDFVLPELAAKGVKRLAVFCPAFVADCLETLEEIGIRAEQQFKAAGGESLRLVPSLNATPAWVRTVAALSREAAGP